MAENNFTLEISEKGFTFEELGRRLDKYETEIEAGLRDVGIRTGNYLIRFMNQNKKRKGKTDNPTGIGLAHAIAKSVKLSRLGNEIAVELGDLDYLNSNYPYWAALNDGFKSPPPKALGFFGNRERPTEGHTGDKVFHHSASKGSASYLVTPGKKGTRIKYILPTEQFIIQETDKFISKILKRLLP